MSNKFESIPEVDTTSLLHSFQEACSNKEFKDFAYGLNVNEEVLMKYTSCLEDAFKEQQNCQKCSSLDTCKNSMKGMCYKPTPANQLITFSYETCAKENKAQKENAFKENLQLFEMSQEIKDASFKEVYKDDKARLPIIKCFKEFMEHYDDSEKPKGIYLHGSFGSGKTYLIASLFNEMAKRNVKSILIYYPDFLRRLKASFNTNYNEQFDQIEKIPLLLLDDIGAENCSNWSRDEVLGPILQYRMENNLPTFFTSNLTLDELEKNLSITSSGVDKLKARRIIERIKQLTIGQELISKNRRA